MGGIHIEEMLFHPFFLKYIRKKILANFDWIIYFFLHDILTHINLVSWMVQIVFENLL